MQTLTGLETLKFNVVDDEGVVLIRATSKAFAERFIESLDESVQSTLKVVPVVDGDNLVLLG